MMRWRMLTAVYLMEWRNLLAYRFVFWTQFLGHTLTHFIVAYFLWDSIFKAKEATAIGGLSFQQMLYYYLLAPMIYKAVGGIQIRIMFQDIYEGGLNKYLLYPLSYFRFKLATQFAHTSFYTLQLFLGMTIFLAFMGIPQGLTLTTSSFFLGIISLFLCSALFFFMECALEQISFWADNVWTLGVLLRFLIQLLGGMLLPYELFPSWGLEIIELTPFHTVLNLPIRCFMGQIDIVTWSLMASKTFLWIIALFVLNKVIWNKGNRVYSGVGI